jgi:serralysin
MCLPTASLAAFTGSSVSELRFVNGILRGDIDGNKVADFEVKVNLATMVAGDFFL